MRLTHLRIAGFKSFVEPTSFAVPSNLVGVVGPNGCGKSNIIDAVRWVLGESKASELRGESMQDVIFNGSTSRKPASRASVELVFDNAEGRAGGSWNQFSEISVKRVLTRDGNSTYFINQQAVRRRDVQDIFLGTGLGPRAYAIIGQGMISRIIEARPEELRIFLEEAAGVSKYKERRRETGNRLADTRDNLTRVEDIRRELGGQIERLEQQAEVARQYKGYEAEKTSKQRLLWFMRLREAEMQRDDCNAKMAKAKAELENLNTQSLSAQTELMLQRQRQMEAQLLLETEQTAWIESNRAVSRLEADLRVMAESRSQMNNRLREIEGESSMWQARATEAKARLDGLAEELDEKKFQLEELEIRLEETQMAVDPVEQQLQQAKQVVDDRRSAVIDVQRELSQVSLQQENASRAQTSIQTKLDRLQAEKNQVQAPSSQELDDAQAQLQLLAEDLEIQRETLLTTEDTFEQASLEFEDVQTAYLKERDRHASVQAQLDALEKLNAQLSESGELKNWVNQQGLQDTPRILSKLQVERGWEKAVESALRECLDSFQIRNLDMVSHFASAIPPNRIAFLDASLPHLTPNVGPNDLINLIKTSDRSLYQALCLALAGCTFAESLPNALTLRANLPDGQRVFTKEGHAVGRSWVSLYAADNDQAGRLERQQQIEALHTELRALELLKSETSQRRDRLQIRRDESKAKLSQLRQAVEAATRKHHEAQMKALRLQEALQRADSRKQQLDLDAALLKSELEEQQALLLESEDRYAELDEKLAVVSEALEDAKDKVNGLEQTLRTKQQAVQDALRRKQDADFALRTHDSTVRECERDIRYATEQIQALAQRRASLSQELDTLDEAGIQASLQEALAHRVAAEEQVAVARDQLDQILSLVSELERREKESDRQSQPLRDQAQDLALKIQAAELTIEQYSANLQEVSADLDQIAAELAALDVPPKASVLQGDVTRLTNAMQALGSVNLAALEELTASSERKNFLDQQAGDLLEAIETLEDAIRKIDKETRDLLQETFEAVNTQFSRLFPQLFGGGEAKLVMSGEEILDAGVQVFAQPPGKKNGTIHLLSGGEKALTATALVFAIFELNPAPFCLLDEVDAPLDDANTERFSRLVRQMSERTQFLFISHNKIAMEMAQQLIGVTMQEKGVSRIVAVDLESAEKLATESV